MSTVTPGAGVGGDGQTENDVIIGALDGAAPTQSGLGQAEVRKVAKSPRGRRLPIPPAGASTVPNIPTPNTLSPTTPTQSGTTPVKNRNSTPRKLPAPPTGVITRQPPSPKVPRRAAAKTPSPEAEVQPEQRNAVRFVVLRRGKAG